MQNLVNEVLQSAVGNYFRNTLQGLAAVTFIETRDAVQHEAEDYIQSYLARYEVETRGVYIQDVDLPERLVEVLQDREIANQQKATFEEERAAQDVRIQMEKSRGLAEKQGALAASEVAIAIASNEALRARPRRDGVATFTQNTGNAEAAVIEAKGARACGRLQGAGRGARPGRDRARRGCVRGQQRPRQGRAGRARRGRRRVARRPRRDGDGRAERNGRPEPELHRRSSRPQLEPVPAI